ncbi:hypothetical protein [Paraferrimonas sedimenticola]|uniref:DUF4136 domain-containing protein n=1 Tax=Paraferrimonas sedimenticola TaxID=375674 RepID=A0AA37RUY1_9GAMM|nr:hypothetical protein [Paraferrimonas sedimenticola]GLP95701.1 hypothetical protein GCM10007895_10070 [Paraferrimonas sedimenticola]
MRYLTLALVALSLAGCAGSPHVFKTEAVETAYQAQPIASVAVVGQYADATERAMLESGIAQTLVNQGLNAKASQSVIPDLETLNQPELLQAALANTESDSLLVISTIDPGYDYDYGDYLATRGTVRILGGEPGAGTDLGALISWAGSGKYQLYVRLLDSKSLQPIWQATTRSNHSGSDAQDIQALAQLLLKEWQEQQLVSQ